MRKTIHILIAGILCAGFCLSTSCSGGGNDDPSKNDTATYTATSDTVSMLIGQLNGMYITQELQVWRQQVDSAYDINRFIEGLELVLDSRHQAAYNNGISVGLGMSSELTTTEKGVCSLDRAKVMAAFEKVFYADSIKTTAHDRALAEFEKLSQRISPDKKPSKALADSVAAAYGTLAGYIMADDRSKFEQIENRKFDSKPFVEGIAAVLAKPRPDAYLAGVNSALQMDGQIGLIEKLGLNIRREVVLENIKKVLKEDKPADEAKIKRLAGQLDAIVNRYRARAEAAEEKRLADSPEAKQNVVTGRALVNKMKESTPQAKTTASGLTYVIWEEGQGDLIGPEATVEAKYTGSHLDGKVFDINENATLIVNKMIPGFAEGLQMLRPGSRATFWIPGDLAYGARGVPQAEIGPMETLVFDVTIHSVK